MRRSGRPCARCWSPNLPAVAEAWCAHIPTGLRTSLGTPNCWGAWVAVCGRRVVPYRGLDSDPRAPWASGRGPGVPCCASEEAFDSRGASRLGLPRQELSLRTSGIASVPRP